MVRNGKGKRQLMSEINVVPYIDVMLVLLIIFMITAPLLTQGIEVKLPEGEAEQLPPDETEPLVVSIDSDGRFYLNIGDNPDEPLDEQAFLEKSSAVFRVNPDTKALVKGDKDASWGRVSLATSLVNQAKGGGGTVGFLLDPPTVTTP